MYQSTHSGIEIDNAVTKVPGLEEQINDLVDDNMVNAKKFGVKGDGITNDYTNLQSAINYAMINGKNLFLPAGNYLIETGLIIDNSASIFYLDNKKISIIGEGIQQTKITYTGYGRALTVINGKTGIDNGAQSFQVFKDFVLFENHNIDNNGIYFDASQGLRIENVEVCNFDYGIMGIDIDNASFINCIIHWNRHGIRMEEKNPRDVLCSARPNNINFYNCHMGNDEYSALFIGATNVNFYGGDVQGNGINGIESIRYGLMFYNPAVQGGVGCNINGVFFESNTNLADVVIWTDAPATNGLLPTVYNITGCTFNRTQNTYINDHNIICEFDKVNFGQQKLVCTGNSFRNFIGAYTPDVNRKHLHFAKDARDKDNCYFYNNIQSNDVEKVEEDNYFLPIATNAVGAIGEYKKISNNDGMGLTLPVGGKWEYQAYYIQTSTGYAAFIGGGACGVEDGGTNILSALETYTPVAFVRRIS